MRVSAACACLVAGLVFADVAWARRLTVTASRADALNASEGESDCSALSKKADADLPLHIVRLRVVPPAGVAGLVRYQWSLPTPNLGMLIADQDIPAGEQAPVIHALCAEIGNECVLTAEQLKVYDQATILYVAPTCDASLPGDATKPYRGGQVKVGVRAFSGKRKAGKGVVSVGYGRTASVTMTLNGKTGIGKAVQSGLEAVFAASVDPAGVALPAIDQSNFANGDGDAASVSAVGLQAGVILDYTTPGKHVGMVTVHLHDGSVLCDNVLGVVGTSDNHISLSVTTDPAPGTFRPGDPRTGNVDLHVRVKNVSDPAVARGVVLFKGAGVLTCQSEIKVGSSKLAKTTEIDFQHCSASIDQACASDGDCNPTNCPACQAGEVCLGTSHCAFTGLGTGLDVQGCVRDSDCGPGGQCVLVLPVQSLTLAIGDATELLTATIPVANTLPSLAKVKETWTVHAVNAPDDTDAVSYSITSNPAVRP
jgi:hypothetical protein